LTSKEVIKETLRELCREVLWMSAQLYSEHPNKMWVRGNIYGLKESIRKLAHNYLAARKADTRIDRT
jgi:hypothetical protein